MDESIKKAKEDSKKVTQVHIETRKKQLWEKTNDSYHLQTFINYSKNPKLEKDIWFDEKKIEYKEKLKKYEKTI